MLVSVFVAMMANTCRGNTIKMKRKIVIKPIEVQTMDLTFPPKNFVTYPR